MASIKPLLDEYGDSHRNPGNKLIHWICVPVIVWTVIALLWALPFPSALQSDVIPVNWATVAMGLAMIYYISRSPRLSVGIAFFLVLLLWITAIVDQAAPWPLWLVAVVLFVLAWIGQFIGHIIEGKRPSFFKDLQFLLIGPAWLMSWLYQKLGIRY
ncbi:MAG TPA: Mpo1-like protein [Xanthomonadales bacterium]|nr:Mpo1-like protein [Xanthomonadales bacterium]